MEKRIDLGYSRLYVLDATPRGFGAEYIRVYIVDGDEHAVAVVETGPASVAESVAKAVAEIADGRQVEIILTHVHIDHGGGAGRVARLLAEQGLQVAIWAHPRGAPHIADPLKLWKASNKALGETALVYGEPEPAPSSVVHETRDGMELCLGQARLRIIHTPGHASHHQSILLEPAAGQGERILFPGDSAGMYDPGSQGLAPTTPPPLRLDMYRESLRRMIDEKPDRIAFTHIGLGPALLLETHQRQVDIWEETVREALARGLGPEKTLEAILDRDPYTAQLYRRLGGTPHGRRMILNSVLGFMDYVERVQRSY